ncbi:glycosyltransferase [Nonomuraea sp. NPDC048826]|uniref:glycosyltransferase n=1 Tax=Nonomuraea sp. NPDC048826 TaxID=3364347 RepID=UPI0037178840
MAETPATSSGNPERDVRSLGRRLAAYVFLAYDPSVPAVAADWWEISGPHYRDVAGAVAEFAAGRPAAADLDRFAAEPGDRALESALADSLTALLLDSPADRPRLEKLVAAADEQVLVDYHHGVRIDRSAPAVGLDDVAAWARPRTPVTIVIPFRDRVGGARARNLLACLAALRDQDEHGARVRVTVVESDSEPRWRGTVEPLADHYLFARHDGHFNKSWAVNAGVRNTPGEPELICVLDTDILTDRRFLARNIGRMTAEPTLSAFLPYRRMYCLDPESSSAAIRGRLERGDADVPLDALRSLVLREPPGACLWVRAPVFHAIGGFDERFQGWGGEDDDVVARLARAGRLTRFDDPLLHLAHPRPEMTLDGKPFNAHIRPLSWTADGGYGDLRGPRG